MIWPRKKPDDNDRPQPEKAQADLERIRSRRPDVERLVQALLTEREENHFAQSAIEVFGRRRA